MNKSLHINKVLGAILFLCLIACNTLNAQLHDTIRTVNIKDYIILNDGGYVQQFDSIDRVASEQGSLVDLLGQGANVQVKNYGLSNLSTLSIRGSSVAQTNVQWNGISIQNAMLGLADISLLPTAFFENIALAYGDESAQANEPAMGGTLFLSGQQRFTDSAQHRYGVFSQYESFENIRLGARYALSKKNLTFGVKALHNQGNNTYTFYNPHKKVEEEISNAQNSQSQFLADASFKLSKSQKLRAHLWYIQNKREIPPTAFETQSLKQEQNTIIRSVLSHSFYKNRFTLFSTIGFTQDQFVYQDDFTLLNTEAQVQTVPVHINSSYYFNDKNILSLKMNGKYSSIETGGVDEQLNRVWSRIIYERTKFFKHLDVTTHAQWESTNLFDVPLTYGVTLRANPIKNINVYAKYGTNYRVPTLNELYYFPGGNELLEPENSKNIEGGFDFLLNVKGIKVANHFSTYSRQVENWIVWRGASIFFPSNLAQVWSRGLENQLKVDWQLGRTKHSSNILYAYTLATSEKSNFVGDSSVGKQVPYIPRYSARWNQTVRFKNILLQWQQAYTGYRFITTDETIYIEPYHLSNLFGQYNFTRNKHVFSIQLRVNNIFGTNYESLRGRIMPRQNYAIGFSWSKAS